MKKHIILTVCYGNMFRSPIAAFSMNRALADSGLSEVIGVISRGIQGLGDSKPPKGKNLRDYQDEWKKAQPGLADCGINIDSHISTVATEDILAESSLILAMEWGVLYHRQNSLVKLFPDYGWKMRLFSELNGRCDDIEDTFNQDVLTYQRITQIIDTTARRGIGYIKQWIANLEK